MRVSDINLTVGSESTTFTPLSTQTTPNSNASWEEVNSASPQVLLKHLYIGVNPVPNGGGRHKRSLELSIPVVKQQEASPDGVCCIPPEKPQLDRIRLIYTPSSATSQTDAAKSIGLLIALLQDLQVQAALIKSQRPI